MVNLLIFILATAGLTWGITRSKLFKPFREYVTRKYHLFELAKKSTEMRSPINTIKYNLYWLLDSLLSCSGCMGFWMAIIIYELQSHGEVILLYAFTGAIVSLVIIGFINYLERK